MALSDQVKTCIIYIISLFAASVVSLCVCQVKSIPSADEKVYHFQRRIAVKEVFGAHAKVTDKWYTFSLATGILFH